MRLARCCTIRSFTSHMSAMLRACGLASTPALVVIARKLLRISYGVWRTGQAVDPGRLNLKTA